MAINYDSLPNTKPQNVLPAGYYQATIVNAEMRISKNTKNPYLSIQYDLNNGAGITGKLYDLQMESEKEFLRYKLQRFLTALQLNLSGSFELKDLCKLINGKKLVVDVTIEKDERTGGVRNTVNSFEHEIYYAASEWASLNAAPTDPFDAVEDSIPTPSDADAPVINAADALDSAEEY